MEIIIATLALETFISATAKGPPHVSSVIVTSSPMFPYL